MNKKKIIYMSLLILTVLLVTSIYVSYGFFTNKLEEHGKLNIVVGTLDYKLSEKELVIPSHTAKAFKIEVTSLNDTDTKYEVYYQISKENSDLTFGYVEDTMDDPKGEIKKKAKKEITLYVRNHTENDQTITLGVEGGFFNNDLSLSKGKSIPKLDYSKEKQQLYTIIEEVEKYSKNNEVTQTTTFILPEENSKLALADNTLEGNVYIRKDGQIGFQGLNNNKCLVKRYSLEEVEEFTNHHEICNQNIYKNLVINGYGEYGDNTNFPDFIYNKETNDFKIDVKTTKNIFSGAYISVDVNKKYDYSMDAYTEHENSIDYIGLYEYDYDKLIIHAQNIVYIPNTLTRLTQDLNNGDKVVYLEDISNWNITSATPYYQRGFIFWNYKDSSGYQYPPLTYSQNNTGTIAWINENSIDKENNTITLTKPWDGGIYPAGTQVSQKSSGAAHNYSLVNGKLSTNNYQNYHATITGANNSSRFSFRIPTKYVSILTMFNNTNISSDLKPPYAYIKNIVFEEVDE